VVAFYNNCGDKADSQLLQVAMGSLRRAIRTQPNARNGQGRMRTVSIKAQHCMQVSVAGPNDLRKSLFDVKREKPGQMHVKTFRPKEVPGWIR